MGNCHEAGSEELSQDNKLIVKEEAGGKENQDVEGSQVKGENKLDKTSVGDKGVQQSSKKPTHSFFGNHSTYLPAHSFICFSLLYQACSGSPTFLVSGPRWLWQVEVEGQI
jgi:hypothetical protein